MADRIQEDELAAAIVAVIGDKSKDGLSPQGEAAVRLALHVGQLRKQLAKRQNNVWHSTGVQVEDGHWEDDCPGETCPVVTMLAEREPNEPLQRAAKTHRETPAYETVIVHPDPTAPDPTSEAIESGLYVDDDDQADEVDPNKTNRWDVEF